MTTSPVGTTATFAATERREAARSLLRSPLLTARAHADELTLVRRHAAALKSVFAAVLGYPLVVEASFARLVKTPLSGDTSTRPARRRSGTEFTARTYAYVALVAAGLLAPSAGEQVLLSSLVDQLRSDAAIAGLIVDDTLIERRHLVAAIDLLIGWGVLEETDGTVAGWGERQEEALLTVNRALLPHLLARPLHSLDAPEQLWAVDSDVGEQPRRTLRRKLVENPLVRRQDLTDAERDALSRERNEISRVLEDSFGLTLEVRAEGALCFDRDDELSDIGFPGPGTIRQTGLLLLAELIDRQDPRAGSTANVGGRDVPGFACPWPAVDDAIAELAIRHHRAWSVEYARDQSRLRDDVVELLAGVGLAEPTEEALVVHPAAARYRPDAQQAPAKSRARARLDTDTPRALSLLEQEVR